MKTGRKTERNGAFCHHNVYVVELDPSVRENRRFKAANPDCEADKPCLYVGVTGLTPEERFGRHKAGIQCSWFVKKYGIRLLPELYEYLNPMPYEAAAEMESDLADDLRAAGHGVWQH
ncbi:MAG: hypothetical protein QUS35_01425 [bacterium]|nr:hypothetical protein [bacterium]